MSAERLTTALNCPVCRARFRGVAECSRCGANLTPLFLLIAYAWRLRQSARAHLCAKNYRAAHQDAQRAEQLHTTPQGILLLRLIHQIAPDQ